MWVPSVPWQPARPGCEVVPASHGRVTAHGTHHAPADTGGGPLPTPDACHTPHSPRPSELTVTCALAWVTPREARRPSVPEPSPSSLTAGQAAPWAVFQGSLTCDLTSWPHTQRVVCSLGSGSTPSALPRPDAPSVPVPGSHSLFLWSSTSCHFSHVAAPQNLPLVRLAVPQQLTPQTQRRVLNTA